MNGEALFGAIYSEGDDRTTFIWTCDHADNETVLEGNRVREAGEVLGNIITLVRTNVAKANAGKENPEMCLCQPKGWVRGRPFAVS